MRIAWLLALLAACTVELPPTPGGGPLPDSGGGGSSGGGGGGGGGGGVATDASTGGDAGNGCIAKQASPGDGHHNAGQDCMNGCHNHGFTLAGTVYGSITGGSAVVGATIRVVDANNQTLDIVSQNNGNFYTSTRVAFPVTVLATSCPNIQPMTASVTGTSVVGCNQSGCHTSANRIHLP